MLCVQTEEYQDTNGSLAGAIKLANNNFWLLFQQVSMGCATVQVQFSPRPQVIAAPVGHSTVCPCK
jgi:hypothetical protein